MISFFIPAALKRQDISAILLSGKERLKILRAANFLTKVEYMERDGSNHWIAAWFDGDTRAGARTVFDFRELIDQFPSVERQIRLLTTGSCSSYSFIGDKSAKIIKEALTTMERTIPLTIPTHPLISKKRHRKRHLNGLTYSSYRDEFGLGEKSRDVQVDGVGLGVGRDTETAPIVTKVLPELARGPEISLAHVLVPHQSYDSDCLFFAVLKTPIVTKYCSSWLDVLKCHSHMSGFVIKLR